jgi:TRAP transporter TAXI family solute receptor
MRTCGIVLAILVTAGLLAGPAHAADVGVITGGEKGTYYQFGLNLQRLIKEKDPSLNVNVYPSKGSVENVYAVYQRPGVQMGIVQSDVLAFVARVQTDPTLRRIAKKLRLVFPLYNEEVHILGREGINEFDDLADRRVAVGREGSGTYLTARLLFKVSDVAPREMVFIDTDEALAELTAGRIDAMFYVAGYPVKLFREQVRDSDRLGLVNITNKSVQEFYPRAEIPAGTYGGWQAQAIKTVAVKAALVSFDFRRADCDYVGRFAQHVASSMSWLTKNGHPKWNAVDLNYPLKGWEQYDCVKKYLGTPVPRQAASNTGVNPVLDAIKSMLSE